MRNKKHAHENDSVRSAKKWLKELRRRHLGYKTSPKIRPVWTPPAPHNKREQFSLWDKLKSKIAGNK